MNLQCRIRAIGTARKLGALIAEGHGYALEDIVGNSRHRALCAVRREVWAKARKISGLSVYTLAKVFKRDSKTITFGLKVYQMGANND